MKAYQNGLLFSSIPTFLCLPLSLCSKWWRLILCKCIFWMNNLWLFWFGYLYLFSDLSWKSICDSAASLAGTQVFDQMQDDKEAFPILLISAGGVQNVSSGLHFAILPSVCLLIHSLIWCLCAALVSISISALEAGQSIIHSHLSLTFFCVHCFYFVVFQSIIERIFFFSFDLWPFQIFSVSYQLVLQPCQFQVQCVQRFAQYNKLRLLPSE